MAVRMRYGSSDEATKKTGAGESGGLTETLLWTNSSPTTSRGAFDATLSDSLQNYTYVKIQYAYNTTSDEANNYVIFPIFRENSNYMFPAGTKAQRMCIGLNNASGNGYVRPAYVTDDTTIHFLTAYRYNASGSSTANLIPCYIYGIK